ncbi:MAG TPA: carbohydrate binding family 9 domain-containing protein [Pyrinomonadaceae bacterium]|nr:carbohydrate binding family 9 domain-containing protein [Pyrinomonadaceae bacterium]
MKIITAFCIIYCFFASNVFPQTPSPKPTGGETEKSADQPTEVPAAAVTENKIVTPKDTPAASRFARKDAPVTIPRLETPPVIDGKLDDAVWQNAALFGDFLQTNPGDNVAPTHPTEFMMGYDSKNLYLAFRVIQDKDKVRATVARRDNIFNDDYIGVFLDTFNDQRQAYIFFFNPLGVQGDGTMTEGRGEDYSVDLVYESKGVLTEDGFTIEAAIPFKSLRYEAGKSKNWGIHIFRRLKYNNNELDSWMPMNRSISGMLNQAGKVTGLEGIETTRQLEINPSFTLSESGRRTRYTFDGDPNGRYVNDGLKGEFGMTAKFSLTPTTTLDFAYNPDFAQVEADAPVSTANVRFPIFFQEKRPFFLERIDIFQSGLNVVNTRAIVDPDIAAKLTGRRGKTTFGLMYASDNAPGNYSKDERQGLFNCRQRRLTDPTANCGSIDRFVDKNADIGVLRIKRDVGTKHNLGFFATTYNFPERHNHTAGFDGRFRLTEKTVAEFQVIGTNSRRFFYDADLNKNTYRTGNGLGYRVYLERSDRNLYMNYLAIGRSKDYRADVGFTNRVDTNYLGSFIQYQTDRDAKKAIIYKRINNATNVTYDWRGRSQGIQSNSQGMLALQRQFFVGAGFEYGYERVFEHEFGAKRTATRNGAFFGLNPERSAHRRELYGFVEATPFKQLFFSTVLSLSRGNLDYDFGAGPKFPRVSAPYLAWQERCRLVTNCTEPEPGYDPGGGKQLYIEASVRYQPTTAWQAQLNYTRTRLTRFDTGRVAFDDNVVSLRSTYQFSRDFFARMRLDYSNISTRLRPQLIFGWTPSPGTAFYAGYNDDFNYKGFNPYTGLPESGLRGNGRTFFIKASYLFRKSF